MKRGLHRLLTLLLVLVFFYNYIGAYVVFEAHHQALAHSVLATRQYSNPDQLSIIRFKPLDPASSLRTHFVDGGNELISDGLMYDVASSENIGDECIVYCMNDRQEDLLIASVDAQLNNKGFSGEQSKNQPIPVSISFEKFIPQKTVSMASTAFVRIRHFDMHHPLLDELSLAETPPPEVLAA